MTQVLVTESHLNDVAEAIRAKNGAEELYRPGQMAAAIRALPTSEVGPKAIAANGTYNASADNLDGYSSVTVNVRPTIADKSIVANGSYDPEGEGLDGYGELTVNVSNTYAAGDEGKVVSGGALVAQTSTTVTQNGTVDTTLNDEVVVNVSGGGSGDSLPSGYKRIEFLQKGTYREGDSSPYINTGLKANQDTKIVADISIPNKNYNWVSAAGIIEGSDKRLGLCYFGLGESGTSGASTVRTYYGDETITNSPVPSGTAGSNGWVRLELGRTMKLNGATVEHSQKEFQTEGNIYLMGMNDGNGNVGWIQGNLRLYRCMVYDGDDKIADMIPCENPSGVIGVYDLVRNIFIAKSNSYSFTNIIYSYEWE